MTTTPRTAAATAMLMQRAAERAAHDPARRGRALRAVRVALAHGLLTPSDVLSPGRNVVEYRRTTPNGGGAA